MQENNEVRLIGRWSGDAQSRELPSGDVIVTGRLVVPRPSDPKRKTGGGARVDTIDVTCWSAAARRMALKLADGEVVEVRGSLRRRFFRAGAGPASRYEVEVGSVTRAPA